MQPLTPIRKLRRDSPKSKISSFIPNSKTIPKTGPTSCSLPTPNPSPLKRHKLRHIIFQNKRCISTSKTFKKTLIICRLNKCKTIQYKLWITNWYIIIRILRKERLAESIRSCRWKTLRFELGFGRWCGVFEKIGGEWFCCVLELETFVNEVFE